MSVRAARDTEHERLEALVAAFETTLAERHSALIQLDSAGRIAHATEQALELLAAYAAAPRALGVLIQREPRELWLAGPRGRLRVRRLQAEGSAWHGLVLEERRHCPPSVEALKELGLTQREAQVLRLLACGKRNEQIARELEISPGTVRKHLEHVYAQLAVSSRSEAVVRALAA
jgi:DNA-binding CsgD family transcriptional regulator